MNKKKKIVLSCILGLMIFFSAYVVFRGDINDLEKKETTIVTSQPLLQKEKMAFWVITDPHYIDETLYDRGEAFQFIQSTAAGKDLVYQKESIQALVAEALDQDPDGLIVTGDITLNGERVSAQKFSELLLPLKKAGIEVFVIPGNHDIHDGWARKFSGENQEKTEQISPDDFKKIFADCGYNQAAVYDEASLSYMVQMNRKYNFLFLDSNIYTVDPSSRSPVTSGNIGSDTRDWLIKQLQHGAEQKKETLVFMHHNLFPHNTMINKGYVLNNAEEIVEILKKYDVSISFSGHIHAQDILTDQSSNITEIVTASFAITPTPIGVIELDNQKFKYSRRQINVEQWAVNNQISDQNLLNYASYSKKIFTDESKNLAYRSLIETGFSDDEALERAAELVGEINLHFFTGDDAISDEKVLEIKESETYQMISEKSTFLREYIDSTVQDKNENDLYVEKTID